MKKLVILLAVLFTANVMMAQTTRTVSMRKPLNPLKNVSITRVSSA